MKKRLWENSLGLTLFILFVIILVGQSITGLHHYNEEQRQHAQQEVTYREYLGEGQF